MALIYPPGVSCHHNDDVCVNNYVITGGPDHSILRVSVRGRGSRHHPAATPPESPDHAAHRQDDRRRLKVCHHSILSTGDFILPSDCL